LPGGARGLAVDTVADTGAPIDLTDGEVDALVAFLHGL
jgi:hypothetical protein